MAMAPVRPDIGAVICVYPSCSLVCASLASSARFAARALSTAARSASRLAVATNPPSKPASRFAPWRRIPSFAELHAAIGLGLVRFQLRFVFRHVRQRLFLLRHVARDIRLQLGNLPQQRLAVDLKQQLPGLNVLPFLESTRCATCPAMRDLTSTVAMASTFPMLEISSGMSFVTAGTTRTATAGIPILACA